MRPSQSRIAVAAATLLLVAPSAGAQQSTSQALPSRSALVARLDSLVTDYLRQTPATGVTVAVIQRGDTLLLKGYGERDRERHLPADLSTVYEIASVTKQFTAAALMRLVERGAVSLEDPLTKHLPQYPQWSSVSVRQLLNHTSGIHPFTSNAAWRKSWDNELAPAALVAFVEKDTLDFRPGTAYRYNNTGYVLLGMIIERASKRTYADYLRTEFFAPLGMRTATYCPARPTDASYARGYAHKDGAFQPAAFLHLSHPFSAGALCMSVPDYLRWQTALLSGRVVSPASLALMTGPEKLADGKSTGYGFGLAAANIAGRTTVQHGGAINGFSTLTAWFPADSLRLVAFVNTEGADPDWLAGNLAAAVFGMPVRPRRPPLVPIAEAELAKYTGSYDVHLPDGRIMPLRLFLEGGALVGQPEGQSKETLLYFGNDTFGAGFDPTLRLTFTVESGKVTEAKLLQRGGTRNVTRRP